MSFSFKVICTVLFTLHFQSSVDSTQTVQLAAQNTGLASYLSNERIKRDQFTSEVVPTFFGHRENSHFDNKLVTGNHYTRTERGRLDRMPVTFGKRGKDHDTNLQENLYFVRPLRDRLNRMPLTFGKRNKLDGIDENNARKLYNSLITDGPTAHIRRDSNMDEYADEYLIRVAKGSLARMPLSFGKRSDLGELKTIDSKDNYFERELRNRLDRMPVTFGKRDSSSHYQRYLNSKEVKLHPLHYADIHKEIERAFEIPPEDSATFNRLQRSKLERMPLAFGKRDYDSVEVNNDFNDQHNIQPRSRLDRMPSSFGKRLFSGPSSSEVSVIDHIDAALTNDEIKTPESKSFEERDTNNIPAVLYGDSTADEDTNS